MNCTAAGCFCCLSSSKNSVNRTSAAKGEETMSSNPTSSHSPLNVEEEYNNSLRTKSFLAIWKKAHHHLKKTTSTAASQKVESERCRSSHYYTHLLDSLLEPGQETLLAAASNTNRRGHRRLHRLLLEYFNATMDAFVACATLLYHIDHTRNHHRTLRRLLLQLYKTPIRRSVSELSTYMQLQNPLSPTNLINFHDAHSMYSQLIRRLASARSRIRRQRMIIRVFKYGGATVCGAAAVAAVVVAVHSVVGIAFLPLMALLRPRLARRRVGGGQREWAVAMVDAAAKGAYIVGRDLDTLSRMVTRLHDEMEHEREVGLMAVQNCREGKLLRELVREMESEEEGFREQLAELEEHVFLCLLTIIKSRKLMVQPMGGTARTRLPEAMA